MERITDPTAVADKWGPGKPGFTDGDPIAGVSVTHLNSAWFDGMQEEVAGVIEHLGMALAGGDLAQLRKAFSRWFGGGVRTINSNVMLSADDAGVVMASAAGGNIGVTLPAAAGANGRPLRFTFVRTDTATANLVTLQRAGADTINGQTAWPILVGERLTLFSDGAGAWFGLSSSGRLLGVRYIGASTTYNPTAGTNKVKATVYGGGGGGGGTGATGVGQVAVGGGGAAGGRAEKIITSGFAGVTATVGGPGTSAADSAGGNGGTSSFGAHCSATGGMGGIRGVGLPPQGTFIGGSVGGAGSGGDINSTGGEGMPGFSATSPLSGSGGGNSLGAGARFVSGLSGGTAATTPGTGGSGGSAPASASVTGGGPGAAGLIIVGEYA